MDKKQALILVASAAGLGLILIGISQRGRIAMTLYELLALELLDPKDFPNEKDKFLNTSYEEWLKLVFERASKYLSAKQAVMVLAKHIQEQAGTPEDTIFAKKFYSLFGIKATNWWIGRIHGNPLYYYTESGTSEEVGGKIIHIRDRFRAYTNPDVAILDFIKLLQKLYPNVLYKPLMDGDVERFAEGFVTKDPSTGCKYMTSSQGKQGYLGAYNRAVKFVREKLGIKEV